MFTNTLPIIFNHSSLVTPLEFITILLGLLFILYISMPLPQNLEWKQSLRQPLKSYLYKSWFGEISLWQAFWPFFLLLNASLLGIDYLAKGSMISVSSWYSLHFILVTPVIWWAGSIWRCSAHTRWRIFGACARLMIFCIVFEYAFKVYIFIYYPRIFFNCEDLMLDMFTCF
jgi:hypothetical protein